MMLLLSEISFHIDGFMSSVDEHRNQRLLAKVTARQDSHYLSTQVGWGIIQMIGASCHDPAL